MKNKLIERRVAQARIHNHMMIQAKKTELEASIQINEYLRDQCILEARKLRNQDIWDVWQANKFKEKDNAN